MQLQETLNYIDSKGMTSEDKIELIGKILAEIREKNPDCPKLLLSYLDRAYGLMEVSYSHKFAKSLK